jgi:hypothetical protein
MGAEGARLKAAEPAARLAPSLSRPNFFSDFVTHVSELQKPAVNMKKRNANQKNG